MEQINRSVLNDPSRFPDREVLSRILGGTYGVYEELLGMFDRYDLKAEWRYYTDGKAWLCKVTGKRKTVVWMSAWVGYVKATVYIPERATDGIYALNLDERTKLHIRDTKNVGKSKPCMVDIVDARAIHELEEILRYKVSIR